MKIKCKKPELLVDMCCQIGEGPLWHPDESTLYYTDIPSGKVYWYNARTGEHGTAYEGSPVGGMTLQADGSLLLFQEACKVSILKDGVLKTIIDGIPGEEGTRFNDVIADTRGRVFAGTMSTDTRPGRLYQIMRDASFRIASDGSDTLEGGYGTPNGMGFTPDRTGMFFNDSRTNRTYLFDYDDETGELSRRRIFRQGSAPSKEKPGMNGRGDGMTVDADGRLWMGEWDGGRIVCYSGDEVKGAPEARLIHEVPVPARKVTCCIFGGADYKDLYITTALDRESKEVEGQGAGALFRSETEIQGVPDFRSRILL